jgi:hypothetical protein
LNEKNMYMYINLYVICVYDICGDN